MPPLPKRRWSTHRQGKNRKSLGVKLPSLLPCPNCGQQTLPHRVCPRCGYYKGKEVIKKTRSDQKRKAKSAKRKTT